MKLYKDIPLGRGRFKWKKTMRKYQIFKLAVWVDEGWYKSLNLFEKIEFWFNQLFRREVT